LCRQLSGTGASLTVLSRREGSAATSLPEGTRIIGSLAELDADDRFDAVINLAGESIAGARWTARRKALLEASRIGITDALLGWMASARHKPRVFLSGSAIGFYGDQGDQPLTEESPANPDYAHALCRRWEQAATAAQASGIRTIIVRIGLVAGAKGGFLKQMAPPFYIGAGGKIGSGAQWMSWIHKRDLINMMLFLLHQPEAQGVFNGTAPEPVTNKVFAQTLGRALHRPAWLPAPAIAFKLAFGEMAELLLTGQRVLPTRALAAGFQFEYPTLKQALAEIYA